MHATQFKQHLLHPHLNITAFTTSQHYDLITNILRPRHYMACLLGTRTQACPSSPELELPSSPSLELDSKDEEELYCSPLVELYCQPLPLKLSLLLELLSLLLVPSSDGHFGRPPSDVFITDSASMFSSSEELEGGEGGRPWKSSRPLL